MPIRGREVTVPVATNLICKPEACATLSARCGSGCTILRLGDVKAELPLSSDHFDVVARLNVAAEQFLRQRVFEITFHGTTHRPRSILRIVSFLDEEFLRALLQDEVDFLGFDAGEYLVYFQLDNSQQLRLAKRMEHDDFIQPI